MSEAAEAWDRTKDTGNIADLELFIARYNDTYYAGLARLLVQELKQTAVSTPAPLSSLPVRRLGIEMDGPVRVRSVLPGTPADKAGILGGDVIIAIDKRMVRDDLESVVRALPKNAIVDVALSREGKHLSVTVKVDR